MVLPIIFGGIQAGLGVASAFGQYNQQQAAIDAQNKSAIANYKQQLKIRNMNWAAETASADRD